jgi:hypothetical protein
LICEGVQHRLQFCLGYLICDKMAAFQFYLQSGKQRQVSGNQVRRVGWEGKTVMLVLVKYFLVKKEVWDCELSWCNTQFFPRQSSERSFRTFSLSRR